jgi:riboflavin synthase
MFTGLVQKTGIVKRVSRGAGLVLEIGFDPWPEPLAEGESVAVNGVCLTVARRSATRFTADVLRETEARTGLGALLPGMRVNLERALRAGDALGGHLVQGHVDGRAALFKRETRGRDFRLSFRCGRVLASQCVLKGSVAIDGVSLTISGLGDDWLSVDVIPVTAAETTIGSLRAGDEVNIETDVIGKYAAARAAAVLPRTGLDEAALARAGFM